MIFAYLISRGTYKLSKNYKDLSHIKVWNLLMKGKNVLRGTLMMQI